VIALMNLRGVRESGTAFAVPTYTFVGVIGLLIVWGLIKVATGHQLVAESAHLHIPSATQYTGLALVFLLLKAFSSGCTALTGVEAISNGVPAFRPPKSKNAATTLALLGIISVAMFSGVTALALISHVHELPNGTQRTVIAQVGRAVFGGSSPFFYLLQLVTALILVLAANTAFNGFPVLASILSRDGYLPRQLHNRGDRLAFSNGILLLSGFAILLIVVFNASPTRLIQLYIIGVFVSFVCSQTGMIRHWNRNLRTATDPAVRRHMKRTRVINSVGATVTAVVLVIVLVTKFVSGAWIVVIAMPAIWLTMRGISRHYAKVAVELTPPVDQPVTLPSSNRAIVLVSKLHLPTLRAVAYARATQPSQLEAVTVSVDPADARRLREEWERADIPIPLTIVASPYRDITGPVVAYVGRLRRESPRDVVTVFIPEYVVGRWWEQLLHNQSALRLKARLLLLPGVIVASVPYQLKSAPRLTKPRPRRGLPSTEQLQIAELRSQFAELDATPISACSDRDQAVVAGTVRAVTSGPRGISLTFQADLWDGTGSVTLSWLGRRYIPGIEPGRQLVARGRIAHVRGVQTIYNPDYELRPSAGEVLPDGAGPAAGSGAPDASPSATAGSLPVNR
jgi:hypothetical protein